MRKYLTPKIRVSIIDTEYLISTSYNKGGHGYGDNNHNHKHKTLDVDDDY